MVFSIPNFTTIGDEYEKKKPVDQRTQGKSFLVSLPKHGKNPDALFTKTYQSVHEGDKYVDPGTADRRYRLEKAKKNISPQGFRYANFPAKSTGAGSYYGTIDGHAIPHETDFIVPRKGDKIERKQTLRRPMYTNPTKKGTYGVPGTTLSSVGQDYIADFYDQKRMNDKKELLEHKAKMKGAAWVGGGRKGFTFDEGATTGVSTCYTLTQPIPPRKGYQKNKYTIVHKKLETPWKPAGSLSNRVTVVYREDPYEGQDPLEDPKAKREARRKAAEGRASWKPNSCTNDSWYTSTIAFKKL